MCGRYSLARYLDLDDVEEFGVKQLPEIKPRYNIAPGQAVPVVPNRNVREIEFFRWGLIPAWARDEKISSRLINARAETLQDKPAFRDAFRRRRCIVLADGFYEWRKAGSIRIPYRIKRRDNRVFGFAALWERWLSPSREEFFTFAIVTTTANKVVAAIHDRMPVILPSEAYDIWLDPNPRFSAELLQWLRPYPADLLEAYEVSRLVNDASKDEPACIEPVRKPLF